MGKSGFFRYDEFVICPNCGAKQTYKAEQGINCSHEGEPIMTAKFCPNCGNGFRMDMLNDGKFETYVTFPN